MSFSGPKSVRGPLEAPSRLLMQGPHTMARGTHGTFFIYTGIRLSCCVSQVTSVCRPLEVTYDLLTPEEFKRWETQRSDKRVRRRRDDVDNFQGMSECKCRMH